MTHAGTIVSVNGQVAATRPDGARRRLHHGEPLYVDDIVDTASRSWLTAAFADGTLFTISQNGRFSLDAFYFDVRSGGGLIEAWVMEGTFSVTGGMIVRQEDSEALIRTRDATIALPGPGGAIAGKISASERVTLFTLLAEDDGRIGCAQVETDAGFVSLNSEFETTVVTDAARMPSRPVVVTSADLFDLYGLFRDRSERFSIRIPRTSKLERPKDAVIVEGSNNMPVWTVPPSRTR